MPPRRKTASKEKSGSKRKARSESDEDDDGQDTKKAKSKTRLNPTSSNYNSEDFVCEATSPDGNAWNLKISSWNVNGIRALIDKRGLVEFLRHEEPDIFCVQETKCPKDSIPPGANIDGYTTYWLSGDTEGYSGVGLYTKTVPENVQYGIDDETHDKEGRVITAEYKKFYLVVAYVPNAGRKLVRLDNRKEWDISFRNYLKNLDKDKPVILCGDLNVAHQEIDLANPKTNKKTAGFTQEERDGFTELLNNGFIDTFRYLHPDTKNAYTFWTYMMNARAKNIGWRLDYFVISERLKKNLCESVIRSNIFGSDHCPVTLFLNI